MVQTKLFTSHQACLCFSQVWCPAGLHPFSDDIHDLAESCDTIHHHQAQQVHLLVCGIKILKQMGEGPSDLCMHKIIPWNVSVSVFGESSLQLGFCSSAMQRFTFVACSCKSVRHPSSTTMLNNGRFLPWFTWVQKFVIMAFCTLAMQCFGKQIHFAFPHDKQEPAVGELLENFCVCVGHSWAFFLGSFVCFCWCLISQNNKWHSAGKLFVVYPPLWKEGAMNKICVWVGKSHQQWFCPWHASIGSKLLWKQLPVLVTVSF